MTISFRHAFRGGDLTINLMTDAIANMGFKNLTLVFSSLSDCHAPLVERIRQGVISHIYTPGLRGPLAEETSRGLLAEPVQIYFHGGRMRLVQSGELSIDVALLGVSFCDQFGNVNGHTGKVCCDSLGYARVDAENTKQVVLLTEQLSIYPHNPASTTQDQVNLIVQIDQVGDADRIGADATRMTTNPRELLVVCSTAEIIVSSGYLNEGFSLQTEIGGVSLAVTRFLEDKVRSCDIRADFALGGITATIVDLHEKGLICKLLDVQSFDRNAAESLARNPNHIEVNANQYANWGSKGASVDRLDVVMPSVLEVDAIFNVSVLTGSDDVLRSASGGHCDTAAAAALSIIVAPLVRGCIPTLVDNVLTCVTPSPSVDILTIDHGIAVDPVRPGLAERLKEAGMKAVSIKWLHERAQQFTGQSRTIELTDRVIAVVCYHDGSVIDVVHQVKEQTMHLLPEYATQYAAFTPELLASRDERQARQQEQLTRHSAPLVSFTVVAPGPIKDSELTRRIFNHGIAALLALAKRSTWIVREQTALVSVNGPEGLLSTETPAHSLKFATTELGYSHPLGRLWDVDALTPEGEILSRRHFVFSAHRCSLCEQSAADCARGKTHAFSDLLTQMGVLLHDADSRNINQ